MSDSVLPGWAAVSLPPAQAIGVDGGASSVRAWIVERGPGGLVAIGDGHEIEHRPVAGFESVARERCEAAPMPPAERDLGRLWIEDSARCIVAVLASGNHGPASVGVCMPGLKTRDGRGIAWSRHGPRVSEFLDRLEQRLARSGVQLATSISGLYSDGDCCGWGEEQAEGGSFRGVATAWYLGGGTGLAEALKVGTEIVPWLAASAWMRRAWELPWRDGSTFEDALSASAMNARCGGHAEERAASSDAARGVLLEAVEALAELALRRSVAIAEHTGARLERVVVGQRLGLILSDPRTAFLRGPLESALAARGLPAHGWLEISNLRAAPAIGAAAQALAAGTSSRA